MDNWSTVQQIVRLTRPFNSVAVLLSFAVGYLYSVDTFDQKLFLVSLLIIVFIHSAFTVQNDVHDMDVDALNNRKSLLLNKSLSIKSAELFILSLISAAIFTTLFSSEQRLSVLFVAVLFMIGEIYNKRPLHLSRRPISSIFVLALFFASAPLAYGFLLSGQPLTASFVALSILISTQRFSISLLKDFKDEKGDRKVGKNTFLIRYGKAAVTRISIGFGLISYLGAAGIIVLVAEPHLLASAALIAIGLYCSWNRLKLARTSAPKKLGKIFANSFILDNYFNLALIICLIAS